MTTLGERVVRLEQEAQQTAERAENYRLWLQAAMQDWCIERGKNAELERTIKRMAESTEADQCAMRIGANEHARKDAELKELTKDLRDARMAWTLSKVDMQKQLDAKELENAMLRWLRDDHQAQLDHERAETKGWSDAHWNLRREVFEFLTAQGFISPQQEGRETLLEVVTRVVAELTQK